MFYVVTFMNKAHVLKAHHRAPHNRATISTSCVCHGTKNFFIFYGSSNTIKIVLLIGSLVLSLFSQNSAARAKTTNYEGSKRN